MAKKVVVVVGASLGGLAVTHRLLKDTLPHEPDLRVNSHFYWNIASVRAVVPGAVEDDAILQAIEPGLAQYPDDSVEFVVGTAVRLHAGAKVLVVKMPDLVDRNVHYDYLVLATGANPSDGTMPWKAAGTYEECLDTLHTAASRVEAASSVVVAGGGPTGVELAAEIKYHYRAKRVVLLHAGETLVGGDPSAASVERELAKLGVDVRKGVKALETDSKRPDGKTLVTLSDGDELLTDYYMPTVGLVPNTKFLPTELLTPSHYVDVDECMRVRGAEDMWAVGDVVSKPRAGLLFTEAQAAGVVKNITLALLGKRQQVVKGPPVDVFLCTIGRERGVGRVGCVHVPSLLVWALKGRTLATERTAKYVNGTMW
ncbi:apoptosis-inducing factor [Drechmeria coniospora]|uniref:Apoptosis-inducing factor n=1 Tax=Drechmeria coniospora TaxID=98403 RepID=A0A151GQF9_DRECN|nr:apoptosis-inducing factor [Drechmeria coniospora]KYK59347.1 apoptosis-inducing factor [Drechmeria coniospora]